MQIYFKRKQKKSADILFEAQFGKVENTAYFLEKRTEKHPI